MGITLAYIVGSLKMRRGFLFTLRDSLVLYYGWGALFNPESVNPFYILKPQTL